jgi:AraC-like DNA-binding protein
MEKVCTIQARAMEKIVNLATTYGVSAQRLYQATQLNPARLADPDHRIPFAQVVALYETAALLSEDDLFGLHLGENVDPGVFDVLGYAAMNSPTLGGAFERVVRYHSIWTDGAVFDIEQKSTTATISYSYLDRSLGETRQDSEMTLAAVVALGRLVTNSDWSPLETRFPHPAPRDTAEHARIFRSPVRFDSGSCQLVFAATTLNLPIAKADQGLRAVLDRHAEELLARYPRQDVVIDRVRRVIRGELNGGDPSLERVASQIGLGPRTLQRRLREQGTSHQGLLDQMRKDLAMKYLREPQMAVCEVAYLLGFSESSALHRAFKRWTGKTPSEFRVQ